MFILLASAFVRSHGLVTVTFHIYKVTSTTYVYRNEVRLLWRWSTVCSSRSCNTAAVLLQHLSDARLEIMILGGVDERIDAAAELHHHPRELIVRPVGIYRDDSGDTQDVRYHIERPAGDESGTDQHRCYQSVASRRVHAWTGRSTHLTQHRQLHIFPKCA